MRGSHRYAWVENLPFTPDDFQIEAMDALEAGDSVLVAAPTGAGKTVVGEFAVHLALLLGRRVFYTTPIKALSNQKFADLRHTHGDNNVGLLTGDTSINPDAPIVVMTTEVLRNMIYAGRSLTDLSHVVLDEVHYLADRLRGPVWEEVIIHLPAHVDIVALSATVSNAEEFGAWIKEIRGSCRIIVSETRPVPLYQHMMVGERLYDLYAPTSPGGPPSKRLNPELISAVSPVGRRGARDERPRRKPRETRTGTLLTLRSLGLLPAIVFIFSRAGCEDAMRQSLASGLVLTSKSEAEEIRARIDEVMARIDPIDHMALGIDQWASGVERGIAAHHAGLLPVMKEAIEDLFTRGLIKVVYATETLALGINMPARTVVIESLQKWNGVAHAQLSAGEYTQLSGRAGRRGIDTEGHSVVLHRGNTAPEEVAALASKRTYPLISAFRPTYNMVVNLLSHSSRARTRELLETSFAQFQADGAVVHLARRARDVQESLSALEKEMHCEDGDAGEYFSLREKIARLQKDAAKVQNHYRRKETSAAFTGARRGDIIALRHKRKNSYFLVTESRSGVHGKEALSTLGTDAKRHMLSANETHLFIAGHIDLPHTATLRRRQEREYFAALLRDFAHSGKAKAPRAASQAHADTEAKVEQLTRTLKSHPVHHCPRREEHAHAGHEWARRRRELERLFDRIDGRTSSVAHHFDRVCAVLDQVGILDGDTVTDAGLDLSHIFGERDLAVVEAIHSGAWEGLDPAEIAALASCFVYEARGDMDSGSRIPPGLPRRLVAALEVASAAHQRIASAERRHGARMTPELETGLMTATLAWARGASLTTTLEEANLQGGDFVRWMRQVMDLLDQMRKVSDPEFAQQVYRARQTIYRGVVAWSAL